jgi:NADH-quinone oxidoreductase subunit A
MYSHYLTIFAFIAFGAAFCIVTILFARLVRPARPGPTKNATYECGESTIGTAWVRFNPRYYIVALVFVIFDVEAIFLFPWAVASRKLGLFAFVEAVIFIGILVLGLAYAWRKGDLEWV